MVNACNHNFKNQPDYSWGNNQAQPQQFHQQAIQNNTQINHVEETSKNILATKEQMDEEIKIQQLP